MGKLCHIWKTQLIHYSDDTYVIVDYSVGYLLAQIDFPCRHGPNCLHKIIEKTGLEQIARRTGSKHIRLHQSKNHSFCRSLLKNVYTKGGASCVLPAVAMFELLFSNALKMSNTVTRPCTLPCWSITGKARWPNCRILLIIIASDVSGLMV